MSVTSNLGLTLIDDGTLIDNNLLNTNYNLIDAALKSLGGGDRETKIAQAEFSYSQMNSAGSVYLANLFDINDYSIVFLSFHALGNQSVSINDPCGWIKWNPGTSVSNYNLFSVFGSRWTNASGSTNTNGWSVENNCYIKQKDGVFIQLQSFLGTYPNGSLYIHSPGTGTNNLVSSPINNFYTLEWPKGNTKLAVSGYSSGILSSSASFRVYLAAIS